MVMHKWNSEDEYWIWMNKWIIYRWMHEWKTDIELKWIKNEWMNEWMMIIWLKGWMKNG